MINMQRQQVEPVKPVKSGNRCTFARSMVSQLSGLKKSIEKEKLADCILRTKLFPKDCALQIKYKDKLYLIIHLALLYELEHYNSIFGISNNVFMGIPDTSMFGIPIIENEELVKEIFLSIKEGI